MKIAFALLFIVVGCAPAKPPYHPAPPQKGSIQILYPPLVPGFSWYQKIEIDTLKIR